MTIVWLDPWTPIEDSAHRIAVEAELRREVGAGHALFGLIHAAVAKRSDQDDVLFGLPDGRVAEVHLTWTRQHESDVRWPRTIIKPSFEEWATDRMQSHHEEFVGASPIIGPSDNRANARR